MSDKQQGVGWVLFYTEWARKVTLRRLTVASRPEGGSKPSGYMALIKAFLSTHAKRTVGP